MEFCNAEPLQSVIQKKSFSQKYVLDWLLQICEGLNSLHSKNLIHRDIKPSNIIFHDQSIKSGLPKSSGWSEKNGSKFILKIGDFGLLKLLQSKLAQTKVGTLIFMSPEMLTDVGHDTSSDIWSLGIIVLLLLITMKNKKNYENNQELLRKLRSKLIMNDGAQNLTMRLKLYNEFVLHFHSKICVIMFECLSYSPEQRPQAKEIISFINSNRMYMRVDPLKLDNWEEVFFSHSALSPETSHLQVLKNENAKSFWKNFFGGNTFKVDWRTFSGAYQTRYKRLGVTKTRGLKKILCGTSSSVVTVFHLSDCIKKFGFPFSGKILEKVEHYGITQTGLGSGKVIPMDKAVKSGQVQYTQLVMNYEREHRDLVLQKYIDVSKECFPIIPIDSIINRTEHRILILGKPFMGKTVTLRMLLYYFVQKEKELVPFYIDVSKLSEKYDKGQDFFIQCVRSVHLYQYTQEIEQFLVDTFMKKKILLLFDGIHEIFVEELKNEIYGKIFELSDWFKGSSSGIILTSRIPIKQFEEKNFETMELCNLTEKQQKKISQLNGLDSQFSSEVLGRISNSLCQVPLFLRMVIELFKKRGGISIRENSGALSHSIRENLLNHRNIHGYATIVTQNSVDLICDLWITKWENLVFQKDQIINFLMNLASYLMFERKIYFNESIFDDERIRPYKYDFIHIKEYIKNGYFDFIIYDPQREEFKFTFIDFQYYLPSIKFLKDLQNECVEYEEEKSKKVFKFLRKKRNLDLVQNLKNELIDPWYSPMIDHVYLQLTQSEFKIFIKSIYRIKKFMDFSGVNVISSCLTKFFEKKNDEIYEALVDFIKNKKNRLKRIIVELFFGLAHRNEDVRCFAKDIYFCLKQNNLITFDDILKFIKKKKYDGDYLGDSLYDVLNLKQKKDLIVKLIAFSKKKIHKKKKIIRFVKILKFLKTQDKNLNNEIIRILTKIIFGKRDDLKKKIIIDCAIILLKINNLVDDKVDFVAYSKLLEKDKDLNLDILFSCFKNKKINEYHKNNRKSFKKAKEFLKFLIREEGDSKRREKNKPIVIEPDLESLTNTKLIEQNLNLYFDSILFNDEKLYFGIKYLNTIENHTNVQKGKIFVFCKNVLKRRNLSESIKESIFQILPKIVNEKFITDIVKMLFKEVDEDERFEIQKKACNIITQIVLENTKHEFVLQPCSIALRNYIDIYLNSRKERQELGFYHIMKLVSKCKRRVNYSLVDSSQMKQLIDMQTNESDYILLGLVLGYYG